MRGGEDMELNVEPWIIDYSYKLCPKKIIQEEVNEEIGNIVTIVNKQLNKRKSDKLVAILKDKKIVQFPSNQLDVVIGYNVNREQNKLSMPVYDDLETLSSSDSIEITCFSKEYQVKGSVLLRNVDKSYESLKEAINYAISEILKNKAR
jgi:ABC-type lipoprotein release transport system permease subunit